MRIIIDENYCKGCGLCISICPKVVFSVSSKRSKRGYLMPEPAGMEKCIGCKLCERICPDMCINVEPEGETKNEE